MSMKILSLCVLIAATSACAARTPVPGASDEGRVATTRNRDLITQQDLDADPTLRAQSVLDVVRTLRPQFLNDRGTNSMQAAGLSDPEAGKVHVSVDAGRVVPLSDLSTMHANEVIEIRYLNVAQAMQRFGTAARQGPIILVMTTAK